MGSSGFCPKCRADIVMLIAASDPDYLNTQRDEYQEYLEQRAVTEAEDRRKAKEKAFRVSRYRRIAVAGFATVFAAAAAFYGFSVYPPAGADPPRSISGSLPIAGKRAI